jgi:CRP/FNR family transcriptional regulator
MEAHDIPVSVDVLRKRFPFLESELIGEISKAGEWVTLDVNEELMTEGKYIRSFPIVLEDLFVCAGVTTKPRSSFIYLNPGQVCAMALTCCMGRMQSNITAYAEEKQKSFVSLSIFSTNGW